ncbi:hypothetical protein MXB_2886 [Myxobolus squamalis]|nr:hypothetical protein MXB_2886 [Myxobolus squamalis]
MLLYARVDTLISLQFQNSVGDELTKNALHLFSLGAPNLTSIGSWLNINRSE